MSFISRIADRLILCPTSEPIDPAGKRRETISTPEGPIEAWVGCYPDNDRQQKDRLVILKFPGAAGRAERASVHPAEIWQNPCSIWTVNQKGYGGSSGPASLRFFPTTAHAVFQHVQSAYPHLPIVVVGNSLGCLPALYLAASETVAAIMLRNPPPVAQMIKTRPKYAAWNFGMSRWIANKVPAVLDCVENAKRSNAPCLFIKSEHDKVVPVCYQELIHKAYSGPKRVFQIDNADHDEMIAEEQQQAYLEAVNWLFDQVA